MVKLFMTLLKTTTPNQSPIKAQSKPNQSAVNV